MLPSTVSLTHCPGLPQCLVVLHQKGQVPSLTWDPRLSRWRRQRWFWEVVNRRRWSTRILTGVTGGTRLFGIFESQGFKSSVSPAVG